MRNVSDEVADMEHHEIVAEIERLRAAIAKAINEIAHLHEHRARLILERALSE